MRRLLILAFAVSITIGVAFSQSADPVGDLRRLDILGANPIDQFQKSAAAGQANSQRRLALAYQNGFDSVSGEQIGRNLVLAAKWFREAALQENATAQFKIGSALV